MGRKSRIGAMVLGGAALSLLAGSLAFAGASEFHGRHGGHGVGHFGMGGHAFLQEMDANGDRSVTREEIDSFNKARAAEIDADKDGAITVEELDAWHEAQRRKRMAAHLATMDSDGDGKVSVAELEAATTWRLARLDRDGDGTIELRAPGRHHGPDRGYGPAETGN